MTENKSLDIAGIGEAAKAIPPDAWKQAVDTACTTFREVFSPITATTSGIGRLIHAKFDRLLDTEKILAAEAVQTANEKVKKTRKKPSGKAKARVVVAAIEAVAIETDRDIRELWSNLLAIEMLHGSIHPDLTSLLLKLDSDDAHLLVQISNEEERKSLALSIQHAQDISFGEFQFESFKGDKPRVNGKVVDNLKTAVTERKLSEAEEKCFGKASFAHTHLEKLELITEVSKNDWYLTAFGRQFIRSVSDPSAK